MVPPQAIPILCQMEYTVCSGLLLMVSWWVPYLPKGYRHDFNNGLGGDSNSGPILAPQRLFEPDSNNGPSPGHSNLVSDEVCICSRLPLMISWLLPYWPRAPRLTSIIAQKMTCIDVMYQSIPAVNIPPGDLQVFTHPFCPAPPPGFYLQICARGVRV